jgi:transposase-like protein
LTENPNPSELAAEYDVALSSLYQWRKAITGKAGTKSYKGNCIKFIKEYAAETGGEPEEYTKPGTGRVGAPTRRSTDKRKHKPLSLKREVVNRFVNHNATSEELIREFGINEANIYSWRHKLLGAVGTPNFDRKAKELARDFITEAQTNDVVGRANGEILGSSPQQQLFDPQPQSYAVPVQVRSHESVIAMEPMPAPAPAPPTQPDALLSAIAEIDQTIVTAQKDRQLLVQQLEIQQLRRQLSQTQA